MNACKKYVALGLLGGALLSVSDHAAAQNQNKSRRAQAEQLIQQGQALLDSGRTAAACVKFEASEALENDVGTLLRLGDCYERAGRSASAWHTFLQAEAVAHEQKDPERAERAAERVATLEPKLIRVVFVVPRTSRVPGLTIRLGANTVPASSWGTPIPVDAGVQRATASAKGYAPVSVDIDASRGEGKEFRVTVPTLAPTQGEPAVGARSNAYRTAGIVTGSVGLAGIGAGALFSALSRNEDAASTCVKGVVQCTPSKSNSPVYTDAATVSVAVGSALLATGITLFVLAPGPDEKEKNALRVAVRYAGRGGRVQLEGVW
ncbi:MAG TPA: hypothetical protein VJV79_16175 [Polyangiaceae bacterium]|nr:hypothetical protein [Polyangiaceae bacterium]